MLRPFLSAALILTASATLEAACLHKFINRSDKGKQNVTLLTGAMTFDEAKALATKIDQKQVALPEWLDANGKLVARQIGRLRVVRPMPVACSGKSSGVVLTASFPSFTAPSKSMKIRFDAEIIEFLESNQ